MSFGNYTFILITSTNQYPNMENIQIFLQAIVFRSTILLCMITLHNSDTLAQKTGGVLVEVQKICVYCGGSGNKLCYSCQGVGSKTYNRYRYTANGTVMEPEKLPCTLCPGTGRVRCEFCSGTGKQKDWELKSSNNGQTRQTESSNEYSSSRSQTQKKLPAEKLLGTWETTFWEGFSEYKMEYIFKTNNRYSAKMWQLGVFNQPVMWNGTWDVTDNNAYTQTFDIDHSVAKATIKWNGDDDFVITTTKHPLRDNIGKSLTYRRISSLNRR